MNSTNSLSILNSKCQLDRCRRYPRKLDLIQELLSLDIMPDDWVEADHALARVTRRW